MAEPMLGAIEAGGTKFICALGTSEGDIIAEQRIETGAPEETIGHVAGFFGMTGITPAAIGIASFGPVELNRTAANYGFITSTPKREWRDFDIVGTLRRHFQIPIGFDTDVNAAALAEHRWGAAQGLQTFLYVTVGTGIGGGAMVEGAILHGRSHPEMGHIRIPHDRAADPFPGICPYHGDCLEGLASGVAIEKRWGTAARLLPDDHSAWGLEADYLALACANWIATLSPQRMILGGGVMRPHLFPMLRERVTRLLGEYVEAPKLVPSPLNARSGVLGALVLAQAALNSASKKASTSPSISPDSRA
jgi:fructokinase